MHAPGRLVYTVLCACSLISLTAAYDGVGVGERERLRQRVDLDARVPVHVDPNLESKRNVCCVHRCFSCSSS